MIKVDSNKFIKAVGKFKNRKALVVGDLMLDEYITGGVERISPEAPVPVVHIKNIYNVLGGAGNVAHNISSLGGNVVICGVVGDDAYGKMITENFGRVNVDTSGVVIDESVPTIVKTRVIAHSQQMIRLDRESVKEISGSVERNVFGFLSKTMADVDVVVISDYGKGMITRKLIKKITATASAKKVPVMVDPKLEHFYDYRQVTLLTPNHHEAGQASGINIKNEEDLLKAGRKIMSKLKPQALLVTRGEKGATLFERGNKITHIPTVAKEVYDVTGAGDTMVSAMALAFASGLSMVDSVKLATFCAGIVVEKVGTATVTPEELIKRINAK